MTNDHPPHDDAPAIGGNTTTGNVSGKSIAIGTGAQASHEEHHHHADDKYDVHGLANPYLGLEAFTYAERDKYAGRATQAAEAVAKLTTPGEQRALLFITGASGSGKSSFAQAGLIPALEQYYQTRHQQVRRAVFRPSKHPLAMLADALQQLGMPGSSVDAATFAAVVREHTPIDCINVIIIDQFEELFTQAETGQRDALFSILEHLPPFTELRTHLVATVRADYLPELFGHHALYDEAKRGIDLRAMTEDELKQAIQRPLQQHPQAEGKSFEPALLDKLARDAAGDATYLPLLQATLKKLWDGDEDSSLLKLSKYQTKLNGNLTAAIQQQADEVYEKRSQSEQEVLLHIFLDLVEVSLDDDARRDVRRRRTVAELTHERPEWARTIDELATARLLSKGLEQRGGREVEVVDIVHESLIGNWARLREAIAAQRARLQQRVRFELALAEWQSQAQHADYLLSGVRLAEAETLDQQGDVALRSPAAQELLKRSLKRREAERQRRLRTARLVIAALSVLLLLAVGAGWFAFEQQQVAEERAREAEQQIRISTARRLATEATSTLSSQPERSILLAIEAIFSTYPDDGFRLTIAEDMLRQALFLSDKQPGEQHTPIEVLTLSEQHDPILALAFSPDARWLAASNGNVVRLWDITEGVDTPLTLRGHDSHMTMLTFSPDSRWLAVAGWHEHVWVWDTSAPNEPVVLTQHTDQISGIAFSPDGKWLATASWDDTIYLQDVAQLSSRADETLQLGEPEDNHTTIALAFRSDGAWLAAAGDDATVRLWDTARFSDASAEPVVVQEPMGEVTALAFSPDGTWLAAASDDATVRLWAMARLSTPAHAPLLLRGHQSAITAFAFAPEGTQLVTADAEGEVRLWDLTRAEPISVVLRAHENQVNHAAFSPDMSRFITADGNRIALWDAPNPDNEAVILPGYDTGVTALAVSADSQWLATAHTNALLLWHMQLDDLLSLACSRVTRNMTWQEWQQYMGTEPYRATCSDVPKHPSVAIGLTQRAIDLLQQGQHAQADAIFAEVQAFDQAARQQAAEELINQATELAQVDDIAQATALFEWARELDATLDLDPEAQARTLAVAALIREGRQQASLRHLERARSLFERAKTIDPTLALDPESVARTTAAEALLIQGEAEARAANLDEAIAFFEEAVELDPTLDIAPDTLARQMVAEARIHQGEELAQQGAIDEALAAYEEAQRMYPAAIPAAKWNNLCWYGSVWNHAHDVLDACERAIEGAPDEMTFYESRGLARALTGDTAGAIDDFTHYIALREQHGLADMARWEGWIDELEANRNPFDEATLRALRAE